MGSGAKIILSLVIAAAAATAGVVVVVPALTPENATPASGSDNPGTSALPQEASDAEPVKTGNGAPPPEADPDVTAQGWENIPLTPRWSDEDSSKSPFNRLEQDGDDYFKAVPAPDGGIYLFVSGIMVSADTAYICAEHYDKNSDFVTSPDLGLKLLGFPPYVEKHRLRVFDVFKDGDDYYLAFVCWDRDDAVFLMKYDKNLNPLYKRPVFIDRGDCPSLVKADGNLYILYVNKYRDKDGELKIGMFRMTVVERQKKIDGADQFFVHKILREPLPLDEVKNAHYLTYPSVIYNPEREEFCLVYNAVKKKYLWGDPVVQVFDKDWKKKGSAVNLYDYFKEFREKEAHDSILPGIVLHNGEYFLVADGSFKLHKEKLPRNINALAVIKCDNSLKKLAAKSVYCKMADQNNKTESMRLQAGNIFNYDKGLAVVGSIPFNGAVLYKLDGDLNVISASLLNGGVPKKADLFVNPNDIERYPPKGILGCAQMLRIPVYNRGTKSADKPVNVEMYYQNKKVAAGTTEKPLRFAEGRFDVLTWAVPGEIQQEEIDVRIKIVPDEKTEEYSAANNAVTVSIPVWDKGMVRGYVCDGSLGIMNWRPVEGAKVTLSAPGCDAEAVADRRGYYEFERVPFGKYNLKVEKGNYNKLEEERNLEKERPVVTLRNEIDNHGTFEVQIEPAGAADKCEVMLSGCNFEDIDAELTETGKFAADVPAGDYRVKIKSPGFVPFENTSVKINLGQATSLTVTMEEATYSIVQGLVCDMYGDPIPNASITFKQTGWNDDEAEGPQYTTHTSETGRFRIELTGYKKEITRFKDDEGELHTLIERGEKIKGSVTWNVSAEAPNTPKHSARFSAKTGYEERYDIYLCDPDKAPKMVGTINSYVPWIAKATFPGYLNYPELNAFAWYGIYAIGLRVDYNPGNNNIIALHAGAQGLAYEMHAVSGKFPTSDKTKVPKGKGWKKWAKVARRVGSKLWELKSTLDEDNQNAENEVPSVSETVFDTAKDNLGPALFIPGVDKHKTSVRVDLIHIVGTSDEDDDTVLWSDKQQWFSHNSPDDGSPNTHIRQFKIPKGIDRKKVKVVVYLKIQKLLLDGQTPDGAVPFYTNQHIKVEWTPGNNKMKAYYVAEHEYLKTTGLSFE